MTTDRERLDELEVRLADPKFAAESFAYQGDGILVLGEAIAIARRALYECERLRGEVRSLKENVEVRQQVTRISELPPGGTARVVVSGRPRPNPALGE